MRYCVEINILQYDNLIKKYPYLTSFISDTHYQIGQYHSVKDSFDTIIETIKNYYNISGKKYEEKDNIIILDNTYTFKFLSEESDKIIQEIENALTNVYSFVDIIACNGEIAFSII